MIAIYWYKIRSKGSFLASCSNAERVKTLSKALQSDLEILTSALPSQMTLSKLHSLSELFSNTNNLKDCGEHELRFST